MKRSDWCPRVRMWQILEQTRAIQRTSRRVATSDQFFMYLQVDGRIGCKEGRIHSPLGWRILFASLARRLFPPRFFCAWHALHHVTASVSEAGHRPGMGAHQLRPDFLLVRQQHLRRYSQDNSRTAEGSCFSPDVCDCHVIFICGHYNCCTSFLPFPTPIRQAVRRNIPPFSC